MSLGLPRRLRAEAAESPAVTHPRPGFVTAGVVRDLRAGRLAVEVCGVPLLIIQTRSKYVAFVNRCPHMGLPLTDGRLSTRSITCTAHGRQWRFSPPADDRTRRGRKGGDLAIVAVEKAGGRFWVVRDDVEKHRGAS
jgi:nitrite reductase/ring-hydroxylating ferredoxin subunit